MKIIKTPILIFEERMHYSLVLLFFYAMFCWQFISTEIGILTLSIGVVCLFFPFLHFFYLQTFPYRKPVFNLKPGDFVNNTDNIFSDIWFILILVVYFFCLNFYLSKKFYFLFSTGSLFLLFLTIFFLGIGEYFKSDYQPESRVIRLMVFKNKIVFFKKYFITEFELEDVERMEVSDNFVEIRTATGLLQEFDLEYFNTYEMNALTDFCKKINNQFLQ